MIAIEKLSVFVELKCPLKNRNDKTITDAFYDILKTSSKKPHLLQTGDCKNLVKEIISKSLWVIKR